MVSQGKVPYVDFFYPQMPYFPYIFSVWLSIFGFTWESARLLAGLFAVLLGLVVYFNSDPKQRVLALLLYSTCAMCFGELAQANTFGLTALLIVIAYHSLRKQRYQLAGLATGVAVGVRLMVAAVIPIFLVHLFLRDRKSLTKFLIGLVCALLPVLVFYIISPANFVFDNWGYHSIRSNLDFWESLSQKLRTLTDLFEFHSLQFVILLIFFALCDEPLLSWLVIVLGVVSLLPTPTHTSYFSIVFPLLIIGATPRLADFRRLIPFVVVLYLLVGAVGIYRYTTSGVGVIIKYNIWPYAWVSPPPDDFRLENVKKISRLIDQHTRPGEPIITWFSGYLLESHASVMPGMENQFGLSIAERIHPSRYAQLKITSIRFTADNILKHTIPLVVLGNDAPKAFFGRMLRETHYQRADTVAGAEIWMYKE